MAFNTHVRVLTPLTEDHQVVANAIDLLTKSRFGGGTRIQSSIHYAGTRFVAASRIDRRRRALLVITDNLGIPMRHLQSAIEDLWEADTLVSALIIPNRKALAALITGHHLGGVDPMINDTGGDLVSSSDVGPSFADLLERIRLRYSLYYRMPPDAAAGVLHTVRVELSPEASNRYPGARLKVRQHYESKIVDEYGFSSR